MYTSLFTSVSNRDIFLFTILYKVYISTNIKQQNISSTNLQVYQIQIFFYLQVCIKCIFLSISNNRTSPAQIYKWSKSWISTFNNKKNIRPNSNTHYTLNNEITFSSVQNAGISPNTENKMPTTYVRLSHTHWSAAAHYWFLHSSFLILHTYYILSQNSLDLKKK